MTDIKNIRWVYLFSILFIIINSFLVVKGYFYFSLLPVILLLIYIAFNSIDHLVLIIVFLVPLSVPLRRIITGTNIDMHLPTEPLLFGLMLVFFLKLLFEKRFDRRICFHPISIAIYFYLLWVFITSITSSMPLISFKLLLTRIWYIVGFYFLATQIFRRINRIYHFYWLFILPFLVVIIYTIVRLQGYGLFNQQAAHFVVHPFFNDHTSYGAIIAMFIPILIGLAVEKKYNNLVIWGMVILFICALILSYTRAAWVSVIGAFGIWVIVKLKIKLRTVFLFSTLFVLIIFVFRSDIGLWMEKNQQESSTDFSEHVQSISNITSDASNLERINRWKSALRMFKERPFLGFGPGTYMFKYAPFQLAGEKTIISTNAGDRGNAHSEYIGPLAEMGIFGMLTFLFIVGFTIYTALKVYSKTRIRSIRIISISTLLGLSTYLIHGVLNNFLDTDKASVPFWGFIAVIVALDVYHNNRTEEKNTKVTLVN